MSNPQLMGQPTAGASSEALSPLQRAALVIKDLQSKLESARAAGTEPIAIVGMSCRFPDAPDLESYWRLLTEARNAVKETPAERWNLEQWYDPNPAAEGKISTRFGGFIDHVDAFDAAFFGIPAAEAKRMDPGQRLLLQQVWHALEHAGIPAVGLRGSDTAFFVGMSQNDYGNIQIYGEPEEITAYSGTGNGFCFTSGRISYQYGFHGPTMTTDTACSSSLVALHQAVSALRQGESHVAIAAGVQLNLTPPMQVFFSRTQSFSPDGRCYTFDHRANGFILGEGVGVVVLMKLSDALAENRTIHALIRNTGVNHGGAAPGLTVPSEVAQESLIRQTVTRAKVDPQTVTFVETHGTGTNLGDPIEVGALRSVYGSRTEANPLYLGSVKTNIGHLNAAAGVAGLIKTVLMLKHRQIVPNLHFEKPNPRIDWDGFHAVVPTSNTPWLAVDQEPRRAAVSSFGLSGTNAHVMLEEHIAERTAGSDDTMASSRIFTYSARTEQALHRVIQQQLEYLSDHKDTINLSHYSYTLNAGRSALEHRCWIVAQNAEELLEVLRLFAEHKPDARWDYRVADRKEARKWMRTEEFDPAEASKWYLSGANIDWDKYAHPDARCIIDIPRYPFATDRFWLSEKETKKRSTTHDHTEQQAEIITSDKPQIPAEKMQRAVDWTMADIVAMQLDQARQALGRVSALQLASLNVEASLVEAPSTSAKLPPVEESNQGSPVVATYTPASDSSKGLVVSQCGEWSLLMATIPGDQTDQDAKRQLIEHLEQDSSAAGAGMSGGSAAPSSGRVLALSFKDREDAITALSDEKGKRVFISEIQREPNSLIFMFPGVGDHYVNMGLGLYRADAAFRADIDYCCKVVEDIIGSPLLDVLFPLSSDAATSEPTAPKPAFDFKAMLGRESKVTPEQEKMNATRHSQTLVFIMEYALARLWQRRGFQPDAMIGYSIGEYVAAVLSGIMTLDDALQLVARRALLIEKLPGGSLLAVPMDEASLQPYLAQYGLHPSINSTPNLTVVGGDSANTEALMQALTDKEIVCRKLQGTHAFHTPMLEVLDAELRALVGSFTLHDPKIPVISNVTGTWITAKEATDPSYWARHTWQTVRFAQGMGELLSANSLGGTQRRLFLEVGPGVSLGSFMLQHPEASKVAYKMNVPSLRTMYERTPDPQVLLHTQAKLLLAGYSPSNQRK